MATDRSSKARENHPHSEQRIDHEMTTNQYFFEDKNACYS